MKHVSSNLVPNSHYLRPSSQGNLFSLTLSWLDSPGGPSLLDHTQAHHTRQDSCKSDRPVTETSTRQHTTSTTERHPCPQRDSNPQSQQARGSRPTP